MAEKSSADSAIRFPRFRRAPECHEVPHIRPGATRHAGSKYTPLTRAGRGDLMALRSLRTVGMVRLSFTEGSEGRRMVVRLTANGWILGALLMSIIGVACDRGRYGLEEDIGHGASALSATEGLGASSWDQPQGDASVGDVRVSAVDGGADCEGVPACVSPTQSAFAQGDPIRISWKNTEAGATRLAIVLDRGSPFEFVASATIGVGTGTFVVNELPVGEYLVRLTDESYQVYGASKVFSVFDRLSASRSLYYSPRDYITVAWRDCDNEPGDWVAIAPEGSSDATVTMWVPTAGRDGAHAFGPLPAR